MSLPTNDLFRKLQVSPGPKIPDSYIVLFRPGVADEIKRNVLPPGTQDQFKFFPESGTLNACAGRITGNGLIDVLSSEHVELVCEDGIVQTQQIQIQEDAPWGISRLSMSERLGGSNAMKSRFNYKYEQSIHPVLVYVVDTGIDPSHNEFDKDRITYLQPWFLPQDDTHGHGTHCAGIIGGKRFGVAKDCTLIPVRAMNSSGTCAQSELFFALLNVYQDAWSRKNASGPFLGVVNLSLGTSRSTPIDEIVKELVDIGLHVVAAACNQDNDASYYSPAGVESVITVGASTFTDSRAWFSNKGSLVDVYAPGVFITSATFNPHHPNDTELKSGTSSACAHVSGLVAYLLGVEGKKTPREMKKHVIELSIQNALTDIPIGSNNKLANFSALFKII